VGPGVCPHDFEAVARQRIGEADAALVEHDQIARVRNWTEHLRELFGERDRRLPGSARERDDRLTRFADRGASGGGIASVIVPGVVSPGSSGTVRCPQA